MTIVTPFERRRRDELLEKYLTAPLPEAVATASNRNSGAPTKAVLEGVRCMSACDSACLHRRLRRRELWPSKSLTA